MGSPHQGLTSGRSIQAARGWHRCGVW